MAGLDEGQQPFTEDEEFVDLEDLHANSKLKNDKRMNKNIHHPELFEELLQCIDSYEECSSWALSDDGLTPLHRAVIAKNYDQVQELLNHQEHLDTIDSRTDGAETALYFASYLGSVPIVLLLLESGAAVTTDILADESELLGAVRTDQTLVVEILLTNGSNIDVMCEDWTAMHIACFNKTSSMIRLLVEFGANVNLIGDWSYAPVNMLFVEFSKREQYLQPCNDEWLVKRCLEALLNSDTLDVNYWSRCALGNPPVLTKALIMLSPTIFCMLINNGASIDQLAQFSQRAVHDELVMFSIRKTHLGFGVMDRVARYSDCLELMINHGIEPEATDFATIARILLRQLRYVPLTKKQPELEPVFRMLINYSSKAIKLKSLCRRVIRTAAGHRLLPRIMSIVGLAPKLKSYLLLSDIGGDELYSC